MIVQTLIKQAFSMLLLPGMGYTLFKIKKLTLENNKTLARC